LSALLKKYKIESVAMESTGVYWIPLFLLLQEEGFEVLLVNAGHVKNVSGRKKDDEDAQWIQKLHRCGLLSASFQPDNQTRALRSVVRHRTMLIKTKATYLNRMQKALEQMNIKLHTIISDIDGKTGLSIVKAILSGERDAEKLAALRDVRIKASKEEIVKSLEAFWSEEHLFELEQCYKAFEFHNEMINGCDMKISKILQETIASKNDGLLPEMEKVEIKKKGKNGICFDAASFLNFLNGVDITQINGLSELSTLTIYSEVDRDMSRWKTEKHFTSWLGLALNTKISARKILSSHVPKRKHYAGHAFRMAAMSMCHNKGPLGEYYRRIRATSGVPKAIVATARKLAVIYYHMVSTKESYNPLAMSAYQDKYKAKRIKNLEKLLEKLKVTG
jgi:transposase